MLSLNRERFHILTVQTVTGFHDGTGNVVDLGALDSAAINADAIVISSAATAVYGTGSTQTVILAGTLAAAATGISLGTSGFANSGDKVVVAATGSIHAAADGINVANFNSTIVNRGLVEANTTAIVTSGYANSGVSTLSNSGAIHSFGTYGILREGSQAFHFTNTGVLDAFVTAYSASHVSGKQVVTNTGTISGIIILGDGDDVYRGGHGIFKHGTLYGEMGNDVITGGASKEKFDGGVGQDDLTGGVGADTFIFAAASDTKATFAKCDVIEDFSHKQHDKIDLHQIDADTGTGDMDAFTFIGTEHFHGKAGELHYLFKGANTFVSGDVDGDKTADFMIELHGHVAPISSDFLLVS